MAAPIELTRGPGLHDLPDPATMNRWRGHLTGAEYCVWLYLIWFVTDPHCPGRATLKHLARDIGDRDYGYRWGSKGPMSQATFRRALERLADVGLVEIDDDPE